jgi:hypothetical protein
MPTTLTNIILRICEAGRFVTKGTFVRADATVVNGVSAS